MINLQLGLLVRQNFAAGGNGGVTNVSYDPGQYLSAPLHREDATMIENNSHASETHAAVQQSSPARQFRPQEIAPVSFQPEQQGEDALRTQMSQLLAGPEGVSASSTVREPGLKLNGYFRAGDGEININLDTGKIGIDAIYTHETVRLQQLINCLPSEAVRKYALEGIADAEKRMQKGEVSKKELSDTYKQVNRLLSNSSPFLSDAEKSNIAAGVLHHTGEGRIDQGSHPTCNVTVLQNIAFDHKPSLAAEMITTAVLTGEWRANDGKVITLPKDSMTPGWEEQIFPPVDGLRSHASQIFQVVALNDVGQRESDPKQYVQKPNDSGAIWHSLGQQFLPWSEYWMSNGYEVWRDSRGRETQFSGLSGRQIQEESQRLFGGKYETIAYKSPYEWLSHPWLSDASEYRLTKLVESEDGLRQTISKLESDGKLPAVVAVNGEMINLNTSAGEYILYGIRAVIRPFKTAHEYIDSKLGIPNHVVTVTKFDRARDRVYVQNSWGKDKDGWVSLKDLWKAV